MNQTNNRIREDFEKEVPAYSMNEYRMEGDIIRPLMVQKEDAWNFMLSKIAELLKSQRAELVEKIEKKAYCLLDRDGKFVDFEDIISIIKEE